MRRQLVEAPARERRPLRGRPGTKNRSPLADERELPVEGVLLVTGEVLGACGLLRSVAQPVLGKRVGPGVEGGRRRRLIRGGRGPAAPGAAVASNTAQTRTREGMGVQKSTSPTIRSCPRGPVSRCWSQSGRLARALFLTYEAEPPSAYSPENIGDERGVAR